MTAAVGVDVGTTNVKAVLVDGDGRQRAATERPLATDRHGDRVEQDAEALWAAVVDAVAEVVAAGGDEPVGHLAVCSQYSSIVPVGADLAPVGPIVLYSDQRGTERSWAIMGEHADAFERFVEIHGIPPVGSGLSLGHLLALQHDHPEQHAATTWYLEPMDYLVARLTGTVAATQATQFMAQVVDNRTLGATAYDAELLGLTGLDADRLPPLVPVESVVGAVRPEVAADLGLPVGVEVPVGMNDSAAGALAAGVYAEGRGGLAVGTTAVLLDTVADKRVDLDAELVSMPSSVPGRYLAWAENGMAGKAVEHGLALLDGSFAHLEAALAASPPGAGGVLFLPWLAGSLAPAADTRARGGFLNVSLDTTREDLVRAMVEGTAHNVAWLLPEVERFTGKAVAELGFFGGAARAPGWGQALADVLGRPVSTLADPETAVAAAVARRAQGRPVDAAPTVREVHEPDPAAHEALTGAHEQFRAAHAALRPLHHALNG